MATSGQTLNDRINAARYTLAGQGLARCVCKATTEEIIGPKKKHLDYLIACTHEPNVSIPQLANLLIERTNHSNWAVVYKALITVHHLMSFGSERFTQCLASSNYSFQLNSFLDRIVAKGYAMSTFIRRYSNYINQKALSYRTLALDLCRTQRSEDSILRTMSIERLLETLPVIQKQLDTLLDFNCNSGDLSNSIITACFTLLFHDAIRLFASYNDGIINLFEKYFDLNKKMCREAFEAYKKFLSCTDRVAEFLKVAESINLNHGELPDFKRAPSSLLDALEEHLTSLESNKKRNDAKPIEIDTKLAAFPSFSASSANFDKVSEFTMGKEDNGANESNHSDSSDIKNEPNSVLDAFEQHLISLENNNNSSDILTMGSTNIKIDAFSSFSANPSTFNHMAPPTLGDISKEFEAQLSFTPKDKKFDMASPGQNHIGPALRSKPTKPVTATDQLFGDLEKTMRQSLHKI